MDFRAPGRRTDTQLPTAGADFEHPAARPDLGAVEELVDLAPLGFGQSGPVGGKGVEESAGVCHRLIEELGEQCVRQIVVLGDVAPCLFAAVVMRAWLPD